MSIYGAYAIPRAYKAPLRARVSKWLGYYVLVPDRAMVANGHIRASCAVPYIQNTKVTRAEYVGCAKHIR